MIAEVAVDVPLRDRFIYTVPEKFAGMVCAGMRVIVPFGRANILKTGIVLSVDNKSGSAGYKEIVNVPDERPVFTPRMIELAEIVARRCASGVGTVIMSALPHAIKSFKGRSIKTARPDSGSDRPYRRISLTPEQMAVRSMFMNSPAKTWLLCGVPGAGKTEVYLSIAKEVFGEGRSILILVPELILTPELVKRVESYFGSSAVRLFHSRLPKKDLVSVWMDVIENKPRIILGTRMAVMMPLKDPGLIIVDEEQDPSYKEHQRPYYNARDVAVLRGEVENVPVLLVSSTPSVETYYKASVGVYGMMRLEGRVSGFPLPVIKVIDLKKEERVSIFSGKLLKSIENTVKKGEQVLLFINRRGFFTSAFCPSCGYVPECPDCNVPFAYHKAKRQMVCHVCGKRVKPVYRCPQCQTMMEFKGYGTERVEEEIKNLFSGVKVARIDQDTVKNHAVAEKLIEDIEKGRYSIIVGTQIATKGHNFPKLTLVAVLLAELSSGAQDFRRSERLFQSIIHAAGRAGRFRFGAAIVQTFNPELPSITYASRYDFDGFYDSELQSRKIFNYPPFSYPVLVEFQLQRMSSYNRLEEKFSSLRQKLSELWNVPPLSPAPIPRVAGRYRFMSFMRASTEHELYRGIGILMEELEKNFKWVKYKVDTSPCEIY